MYENKRNEVSMNERKKWKWQCVSIWAIVITCLCTQRCQSLGPLLAQTTLWNPLSYYVYVIERCMNGRRQEAGYPNRDRGGHHHSCHYVTSEEKYDSTPGPIIHSCLPTLAHTRILDFAGAYGPYWPVSASACEVVKPEIESTISESTMIFPSLGLLSMGRLLHNIFSW